MDKHTGKMIAPIVITVLVVLYYAGLAAVILRLGWDIPLWGLLCLELPPLAIIGVMVYVLVTRIKEIRSGEEDDLSQY